MAYMDEEINSIIADHRRGELKPLKGKEVFIMKKIIFATIFFVAISLIQSASGDEIIECPCCSASIYLETPKAREIGCGCVCDGCQSYYVQGMFCPWCKLPRYN